MSKLFRGGAPLNHEILYIIIYGKGTKMKKLVILLAMVSLVLVGGCASLPTNFAEKAQTDLSKKLLLYQSAEWLKGAYGYQDIFFKQSSSIRGALVCDEETVMFVVFDKRLDKYISTLDLNFGDLKNVSVGKFGFGRRLVLYGRSDIYTFEISKQNVIDRTMTYKFAIFIAKKLNQNTEEFSKELEKID
jgi:hypothetical protein